jgi:glycosyltransferase involved in cell wall biosynthesis
MRYCLFLNSYPLENHAPSLYTYRVEDGCATVLRITIVQIHLTGGSKPDFYHVQAFGLARRLVELGCSVTVITADSPRSTQSETSTPREKILEGFRVVYLPISRQSFHQTLVTGLGRSLRDSEPDVVQVSELVELTTLQTVLWCKTHGVPAVIWNGAYQFYGKGVWAQKAYLNTAGRIACRLASGFVAKTTSAKAFLESLGARPDRVFAVPVGLDTETFLGAPGTLPDLSWVPSEPFLMNVGQMTARKNQVGIIRALKLIHEEQPEFRLLIVGSGPALASLASLAGSLGLTDRVVLRTEPVPNTTLAHVYSRAFVTVMASWYEIFGMAILESLACGAPVIGRRTGGIADVVKDGENGWLYDEDDCGSIARLTLSLYRDSTAYSILRRGARDSSKAYDWKTLAPRFLDVYKGCLPAGKGGVS